MDKILKLNDVQIHGVKANPTVLINKLNRAVSKSEYGKNYIDGLIDTVGDDRKFTESIISKAQKALKSYSINVKNRYLRSRHGNFNEYMEYGNSQIKDADHDIKIDIHEERLVLKQLKRYTSDTVVEERGCFENCIHPLTYSKIK